MPKDKLKVAVAAYVILAQDNEVLLLKRGQTGFEDGKYSMIAGHIEPNETPAQTAVREAWEEAGINVKPEDLRLVHIMYRQKVAEGDVPYVDFYLECRRWQGNIQNMESKKCEELSWFHRDDLPSATIPYIRQVIERTGRGELYSEFGW